MQGEECKLPTNTNGVIDKNLKPQWPKRLLPARPFLSYSSSGPKVNPFEHFLDFFFNFSILLLDAFGYTITIMDHYFYLLNNVGSVFVNFSLSHCERDQARAYMVDPDPTQVKWSWGALVPAWPLASQGCFMNNLLFSAEEALSVTTLHIVRTFRNWRKLDPWDSHLSGSEIVSQYPAIFKSECISVILSLVICIAEWQHWKNCPTTLIKSRIIEK